MSEDASKPEQFRESLTAKEREIVDLLTAANGDIVPKAHLLAVLQGRAPRTLDTYVKQIRAKMRLAGLNGTSLKTHVGVGYALAQQV
jgi:DNA-binding response OmpR family regulator